MTHEMRLNSEPFDKIKSGKKKIEMRLFDEKRRKINVGDTIFFINRETSEKLTVMVKELHIFKSFDELYERFPKEILGYNKWEIALPVDMEQYYLKTDIEKYGVVGIEIELI